MNFQETLVELKLKSPLVHCITNYVAMNISANILLSVGASPAMIHAAEETPSFTKIASSLSINIGTISPYWYTGIIEAIKSAKKHNVPWVFDPVAHFATEYRNNVALEILEQNPSVLRGNASEIISLSGDKTDAKGVDSKDPVEQAENIAYDIAKKKSIVVVVTGEKDFITNGNKSLRITGGSDFLPKVTAMGCSLTSLIAAVNAITNSLEASIFSLCLFAEASEKAHAKCSGPGTFSQFFLDELNNVDFTNLNTAKRLIWI